MMSGSPRAELSMMSGFLRPNLKLRVWTDGICRTWALAVTDVRTSREPRRSERKRRRGSGGGRRLAAAPEDELGLLGDLPHAAGVVLGARHHPLLPPHVDGHHLPAPPPPAPRSGHPPPPGGGTHPPLQAASIERGTAWRWLSGLPLRSCPGCPDCSIACTALLKASGAGLVPDAMRPVFSYESA